MAAVTTIVLLRLAIATAFSVATSRANKGNRLSLRAGPRLVN